MNNKPFEIVGVDKDLTLDEITDIFNEKCSILQEDIFEPGEKGNQAVKNLDILKEAYNEIVQIKLTEIDKPQDQKLEYNKIKDLIKKDEIDKAQEYLDSQITRNGLWNYLQAIVYMKKGWVVESKKQLEIACKLEPENEEFKNSYEMLISNNPEMFLKDFMEMITKKTLTENLDSNNIKYTNPINISEQRKIIKGRKGDHFC